MAEDKRAIQVSKGQFTIIEPNNPFGMRSSTFTIQIALSKELYCERCLGEMVIGKTKYEQVGRGGVAEQKITSFKCKECGHEYDRTWSID